MGGIFIGFAKGVLKKLPLEIMMVVVGSIIADGIVEPIGEAIAGKKAEKKKKKNS
jgi:hypothetical protein